MPSQKKIMKALAKVKKAKRKVKKRARKARATQEIKQIVNVKGLGSLSGIGSPPASFLFQTQREGPVSSSEDFMSKAIKQLNRINQPSESTQEIKENMRKLEKELSKQALTNKQLILEGNLLKTKYDIIKSRTDGVGDFSQPNKARDVRKEQQLFQDRSILTSRRGNRGPMSEESKAKGRETRAKNRALRERMQTPAPMMMSKTLESEPLEEQAFDEDPEPESEIIDYKTRRDTRLSNIVKKSDEQDIFI